MTFVASGQCGQARRVLILHRGGDQIRGTEVCLFELASALRQAGCQLIVCRNDAVIDSHLGDNVETIIDEGFPEIMIDGGVISLPLISYAKSLLRLYRLIRRYRPGVMLASGGLPCQLAVPAARLTGIPVVCHFHHPAPKRYLYLWLVRFVDRLIFPSNFTRSIVEEKCGRTGDVVYNGVDVTARFVPVEQRDPAWRARLGIDEHTLVFCQVGHLSGHKRPDFLLRAFVQVQAVHPQACLVFVGDGPLRGQLESLAADLGVASSVVFAGYVPDVLPYYQHVADINLMASSEEGLGIVAIEAGACGVPSIVTACTGLLEVIADNVNGFTFDMDNSDELVQKMVTLAADPGLRKALGRRARENALRVFDLQSYRRRMTEIFFDI